MITIGIIGFGIVGRAVHHGFREICDFRIYDKNPTLSENTLKEVCEDSEFIFICVPTPMDLATGVQDSSIVESVIEECSLYIEKSKKVLIIKSTLIPGTTEKIQHKYPWLDIVFNPEFLRESTYRLDFINTSRIILGGKYDSVLLVEKLYRKRFPKTSVPIYLTDSTTAETVKCLANCFLATKVLLCNEFYDICNELNVDYDNVINLILADGRIGKTHTQVPGSDGKRGVGGLCFPKDLCATIKKAEEIGVNPIIMKAAWKKNLQVRKERDWEDIEGAVS